MLITIYGCEFGPQESIAWILCDRSSTHGPQMFELGHNNKIVNENRESKYYNLHQVCMQRMENYDPDENNYVNFLQDYRYYEEEFQNVVWANYYGRTKSPFSLIKTDKLIYCDTTFIESFFYYVVGFAHQPLKFEDIDRDSDIWWFDHHHVDGKDTTRWKEIWYSTYHEKMKKLFECGDLKYFWQLNFLHWDLHKSLFGKIDKDPFDLKINEQDDYEKIWDVKLADYSQSTDQKNFHIKNNADMLLVHDNEWIHKIDEICDYTNVTNKRLVYENLNTYMSHVHSKRQWFEKIYKSKINHYHSTL